MARHRPDSSGTPRTSPSRSRSWCSRTLRSRSSSKARGDAFCEYFREDEGAAASIGKRVFVFRLQSFVVGSMLMGLGGALYAHFVGFIAPEDFLPILTFQLWAMLIVGGSGSNKGAILGAAVVWGF